jgi:hypothetical protein
LNNIVNGVDQPPYGIDLEIKIKTSLGGGGA